jgi:hypothetical protein
MREEIIIISLSLTPDTTLFFIKFPIIGGDRPVHLKTKKNAKRKRRIISAPPPPKAFLIFQ